MLKNLKKTIYKNTKGHCENDVSPNTEINKEIEIMKKNQIEIKELKSKITEMKNSLEGFNSRFRQAEKKSANLKKSQLKLPTLRSRKKN